MIFYAQCIQISARKKSYLKILNVRVQSLDIFSCQIKKKIKYEMHTKSIKIDAFGQDVCFWANPMYVKLQWTGN